jgi:hypothetical protein
MGKCRLAHFVGEIGALCRLIAECGSKAVHRNAIDLHAAEHHFEGDDGQVCRGAPCISPEPAP